MAFWGELAWEAGRFIFLAAMAVGGIFAGKKLRDHKTAKDAAAAAAAQETSK